MRTTIQSALRLLVVAAATLSASQPAAAQKTYAMALNGTIFEVDFGTATTTALWSTGLSLNFGLANSPNPDVLYGSGFTSGLWAIDMVSQTVTSLGTTSPNMATIVLNENDGLYYGSNWTGLYSVDPVAPSVTPIGSYGLVGMYGLEYHPGLNKMLGCQVGVQSLYSIDIATGAPTVIGPHGTNQVVGIWYDHASGRTFGVTDLNAQGQLLEFDVTTGQATVLATTGINFVAVGGELPAPTLISTYCSGDGTGTACPCGNLGSAGAGCINSLGVGAALQGLGTSSVASDDLVLAASALLPGKPALAFYGTMQANGGLGVLLGDGLLCVSGQIQRLNVQLADGSGNASWGPGLAASQGFVVGDTRDFQIWYRDPIGFPCGSGYNLTNAVEVTFTP